jgi:hypothetical protein
MLGGVIVAVTSRLLIPDIDLMYHMFLIFPASVLACITVCLLTPPDEMRVLKVFYRDIRPWGFWGPVREALAEDTEDVQPNRNCVLDMFNVANGIVWQLCLMAAPMCLVVRRWDAFWWTTGVVVLTSVIMKFTWYDRLPAAEPPPADDALNTPPTTI